jgi:hypothetical protein
MKQTFLLICALLAFAGCSAPPATPTAAPAADNSTSAGPVVITAVGKTPDDVRAQAEQYKALFGGQDNANQPGSQANGFRSINWDKVPDEFAAPNFLPAEFFNDAKANRPRGAILKTPGQGVMVSANAKNPTNTLPRFGNLNPAYADSFKTFSVERLFSPVGSNIVDLTFVVPGTNQPAVVRGFGAIYTDVDTDHTAFEYFDAKGNSLGKFATPISDNGLSFLGVAFPTPIVSRVRIAYGTTALGPNDSAAYDVAVMDDFIYGEPQAAP